MDSAEAYIRNNQKLSVAMLANAYSRLCVLQLQKGAVSQEDVLQSLKSQMAGHISNIADLHALYAHAGILLESTIVPGLTSNGMLRLSMNLDVIGNEELFFSKVLRVVELKSYKTEYIYLNDFRVDVSMYLQRVKESVLTMKASEGISPVTTAVTATAAAPPAAASSSSSSFAHMQYRSSDSLAQAQVPTQSSATLALGGFDFDSSNDLSKSASNAQPRIEFERAEPIVRLLAQVRKVGMDILFPQSTHDTILACIFVAVKSFATPAHRELIDMVMLVKDSNKAAGLENVSKTKIRGVLALLKHGDMLITHGDLGEPVRLFLADGIDSFQDLREKHDTFLNMYIAQNHLFVPTVLKRELVWQLDDNKRAALIQGLDSFMDSLKTFFNGFPEYREMASRGLAQASPSGASESTYKGERSSNNHSEQHMSGPSSMLRKLGKVANNAFKMTPFHHSEKYSSQSSNRLPTSTVNTSYAQTQGGGRSYNPFTRGGGGGGGAQQPQKVSVPQPVNNRSYEYTGHPTPMSQDAYFAPQARTATGTGVRFGFPTNGPVGSQYGSGIGSDWSNVQVPTDQYSDILEDWGDVNRGNSLSGTNYKSSASNSAIRLSAYSNPQEMDPLSHNSEALLNEGSSSSANFNRKTAMNYYAGNTEARGSRSSDYGFELEDSARTSSRQGMNNLLNGASSSFVPPMQSVSKPSSVTDLSGWATTSASLMRGSGDRNGGTQYDIWQSPSIGKETAVPSVSQLIQSTTTLQGPSSSYGAIGDKSGLSGLSAGVSSASASAPQLYVSSSSGVTSQSLLRAAHPSEGKVATTFGSSGSSNDPTETLTDSSANAPDIGYFENSEQWTNLAIIDS